MSEPTPSTPQDEDYKRYVLKKSLETLKNKTGFHTALVSLFVPPSRKIFDVIAYLKNEINESSNIKSKANRNNVLDSITSLIQRLRLYKEVPPNGLILYSGQIPVNNAAGTERSELYVIEPPEPISIFKYYCSSQFLLEPLYDMLKEKGTFGIINIDNKDAAVGWVKGAHLEVERRLTSGLHSKHGAGGQSQRRFERLIEEGAIQFYLRVGDAANEIFKPIPDLEGIYVSGAGMAKDSFIEKSNLDYTLKDKILGTVDVAYTGDEGIRETLIKIQDKMKGLRYIKEKKVFATFMNEVVKEQSRATYGEKEIRKALLAGAVDLLLVSEKLKKNHVYIECPVCHHTDEKTIGVNDEDSFRDQIRSTQCPKCNSSQYTIKEIKDLIEDLGDLAEKQGTQIQLLSPETEEGDTLFSTFGGLAAILRFIM